MSSIADAQLIAWVMLGSATVRYGVQLVLGVIVALRSRPEDLPKIVQGFALWFRRGRK
ncbi:hypothetical protein [Thermomonospora cellulosilytica]|uniref:Uncharacterized protein n=1 Tax=Thermomonospora cellulosilytica TaxID=1411118 RepID=A0A7W3MUK6_9ACTN|nr:hypothetical protein [Thermomonospora cellulosilytica]MBA9002198.1 hypothetical protein [Thermomonospora cellulosilytica]